MNAVGKLGSYISRSVTTVSGPFHPFGGAVDIIVVEQPDGSFKSSPWYVRFGKFQGVLKAKEKIISIVVNGVDADFHMYLDHKGEAHFLREVEGEDADSSIYSPSSGDDTDGQSRSRWPVKSKSCNYDSHQPDMVNEKIGANNEDVLNRTSSRRSRILGFVLGRRSAKENRFLDGENDSDFVRKELLESAEIAADLLEVKWSRSLVSSRRRNNGVVPLASHITPDKNNMRDLSTCLLDGRESIKHDGLADDLDGSSLLQQSGSSNNEKDHSSHSDTTELQKSVKESGITFSCLVSENVAEASPVENTSSSMSQHLSEGEKLSVDDGGGRVNLMDVKLEACSGEHSVLENLHTTDLTFEKCQSAVDSNFTRPSCFQEIVERDLCIFSQNGRSLECEGIPLDEMESQSTSTICSLNSQNCRSLLDQTMSNDGTVAEFEAPLDNQDDPIGPYTRRSKSPEAEQLFFGDLDDMIVQRVESMSPHNVGECELPSSQERTEENQSPIIDHVSVSSTQVSGQALLAESAGGVARKLKAVLSDVNIQEPMGYQLEDVCRTARSLPNMSMHDCGVGHSSGHAPHSEYASSVQAGLQKDILSDKVEADSDHQPSTSPQLTGVVRSVENLKNGSECPTLGTASRPSEASPRSWKSWSFTSKRSRSMKWSEAAFDNSRSSAENVAKREDENGDEKGMAKVKATKRKIRATTPSSEQLKSLKLKEGTNIVAFTFATPMLGKQEVDARIHLWKWDSRIVISDVDGTITRSDLLGQVMPLVGVDWSQTGVAHLFSAIKENGYHVLFLSARAISQAYLTRQFLCNLKQDGKALPEGPVVISPDGLFPSLYREVVRRAPHEFKISCLEAIKALFPPDRNPFYAGFGNRDTDEISYLKVGIPKGKIFIINPKGEIVVNSRVDRNSYKSLHALVNDMFPLMSSSEQEDFNSWNYWKLPLPSVDI